MNVKSLPVAVAERVIPKTVLYRLRAYRSRARGHNPELALLPKMNHRGIFLDIGANIGDFSRVASLIFREVVAFEPIPELASKLRAELPEKVTVHALALADTPGASTLYVPQRVGETITALASLDRTANQMPEVKEIPVETRTVDSFGFSCVDVIKIGVEGLEEFVLKGARDTLRANRPVVIVEIEDRHHPGKTVRVFQFLWDLGFKAFYYLDATLYPVIKPAEGSTSEDMNRSHLGTYVNNFIFLHPQRPQAQLDSLISSGQGLAGI